MGQGDPPSDALSWVRVDLGRLAGNVSAVLRASERVKGGSVHSGSILPGSGPVVCGVVKKNAYGLGATAVGRAMQRAGCGMLAVYSAREAEELVSGGLAIDRACPVLLLMPVHSLDRRDVLYRAAAAGGLHLTVHSSKQAERLDEAGRRLGLRLPVHVHVDTGMGREGMSVDEAERLWRGLHGMRGLAVTGLMSHLASADVADGPWSGFTEAQESAFDGLVARLSSAVPGSMAGVLRHTGNSASLWRSRPAGAAGVGMREVVRPGLALYGYGPPLEQGEARAGLGGVRPVVRWCSRVIRVRRLSAGLPVGYRCSTTLKRDSVLGLVPAGYGDGYPLALSNRGMVRVIRGAASAMAAVVGRVNMDQLVIDLTDAVSAGSDDAADGLGESWLGAEVEVYGDEPGAEHGLARLAEAIDSHAYELLCRLNPRLPRVYVSG